MSNSVTPPIDQCIIDELRSVLENEVSNQFNKEKVCLLLSGGMDSTTLGLVSHHIGKQIVSVSFELEGEPNLDCIRSENTSKQMGWEFHKVIVPRDDYENWFFKLIFEHRCKKKTELEVLYPFIFLLEKVKELGFKKVLCGNGNPIPDGRNDSIQGRRDWVGYMKSLSNEDLITDGTQKCIDYGRSIGVDLVLPLSHPSVRETLTKVTYDQLHHPFQKTPFKRLYENDVHKIGLMEVKNLSLQKGNGFQELYSSILKNPQINIPNYHKGNNIIKLNSLIKWWSKKTVSDTQTTIRKFEPYTLEDMKRESQKELFSVVTTFSGGGGSSVGYKLGGGKILLMNEFIEDGVNTYLLNHPNTPHEMCDIRKISRKGGRKYVVDFFKSKGIEVGNYDILDGSPPCSTFSTSGKGQIKNEERNVKYSETVQSRIGMLIHDFVYFVNCTQPKICLIENVPTIKNSDVFQHSLNRLRRRGYRVNSKVMNSSHFGVPQNRRRLICIGIRKDVCEEIGLRSEDEILDFFPIESSYQPTLREGLDGVEIDEFERRQLILSTIRSTSYEFIKSIPKNPSKGMKISHLHPHWTSDFNMVRSSWDLPSPTLTQMGQQLGRGGIFHPSEDRGFTTNEMKRLMGLPVDYKFSGTFNQRMERMGRMVSPLIYKYLSKSLYENVLKPTQNLHYVETV